jgi:hypothetical protein
MTSGTPRDALLKRRELLKARLAAEEELRPLSALLESLGVQGADFTLIRAKESLRHPLLALLGRLPNLGSRIDWSRMADTVWLGGRSDAERREALKTLLEGEDRPLLLTWDNGALPALLLSSGDIVRNADAILDVTSRCWIFDPDSDWLVEGELGGDVRRGRIPG